VQKKSDLIRQWFYASVIAAYVGVLGSLSISLFWRIQAGTDARICPADSQTLQDWCTIGEFSLAYLLNVFWALFGIPFALVLTVPCAFALSRLVPTLERHFGAASQAAIQYILAAMLGLLVGLLLQVAVAGLAAALSGVWAFRRVRYPGKLSDQPSPTT
jgi:hypothetical protein